mmetsp:Transcript_45554/g.75943  ORF Transcript_45554/g.75943 Transcript_45554/m.75943 type:complete len:211 (-) Transcript_45554:239-871(-)
MCRCETSDYSSTSERFVRFFLLPFILVSALLFLLSAGVCSFSGSGHTFRKRAQTESSKLPGLIWISPWMVMVCSGTSERHTWPTWAGYQPSISSHISFKYACVSLKVRDSLMLSCLFTSDITILQPSQCWSLVTPGSEVPKAEPPNISGICALTSSERSSGLISFPCTAAITDSTTSTARHIRMYIFIRRVGMASLADLVLWKRSKIERP